MTSRVTTRLSRRMRQTTRLVALAAAGSLALTACGGSGSAGDTVTLNLVGYAVPKAANNAIQAKWAETADGKNVKWVESYGASGDQSRAVEGGLKADYVHFSLATDVTRLVDAGLVAEDWDQGPNHGIVSTSAVALVVRKGNPKNIQGWDDIVKPGIGIVTPNPSSSGSARWNILAAWGHVIAGGGTEDDAKEFVTKFFENAVALPGGARDATTSFNNGVGDVLISYENEAILARAQGEEFDYIVPDDTLLIENAGAVLKDANPLAQKWLDFVLSKTGQTEFMRTGFRPLIDGIDVEVPGANDPANPFPTPSILLTIDHDFGGWSEAKTKFFDEETGIIPAIQKAVGKE